MRHRRAGADRRQARRIPESRDEIDIQAHPCPIPPCSRAPAERTLPRVAVDARARIDIGAQRFTAQVQDISTDGVKIFTEELLSIGDEVRVVLQGPRAPRARDRPLSAAAIMRGSNSLQRLPISRLNAWLAAQSAHETDDQPWSPPIVSKN